MDHNGDIIYIYILKSPFYFFQTNPYDIVLRAPPINWEIIPKAIVFYHSYLIFDFIHEKLNKPSSYCGFSP